MNKKDMLSLWHDFKTDITFLFLSGLALLFSMFAPQAFPADPAWVAIVLCGFPIVKGAVVGLVTEFDIKADVLVATALIASVIIGEDFAAGEVAFIMQLGSLLEEATTARARAGIEKLVNLTPRTARFLKDGKEVPAPAEVRAKSTPLKSSLCCRSLTSISFPRKRYVRPALREEPNNSSSSIFRSRSSRIFRNS